MKTGYLGSSKADPRSDNVINSNQTSVIRVIACARPTSKGASVDHQCVAMVILPRFLSRTEKADLCNLILKMILVTQLARYEEWGPDVFFVVAKLDRKRDCR